MEVGVKGHVAAALPPGKTTAVPTEKENKIFLVCFLLDNSPASEFYMPTFRNTLSVPSS